MHKFSSNNLTYEIGDCMRKIKSLTNELDVNIWLVVHPSKTQSEDEISEYTLRGSAEIAQICDNLLLLRADKLNNTATIELKLSRSELSKIGKLYFDFNVETLTYKYKCDADIREVIEGELFKNRRKKWSGKKTSSQRELTI